MLVQCTHCNHVALCGLQQKVTPESPLLTVQAQGGWHLTA